MIRYRAPEASEWGLAQDLLGTLAAEDGGTRARANPVLLRDLACRPGGWLRVVLAVDEVPLGIATYFPEYSSYRGCVGTFVGDLYVRPEGRGRGIGRGLIAAVHAGSADWGSRYVSLLVHRDNAAGRAFYNATGFRLREDSDYLILEGEALDALRA